MRHVDLVIIGGGPAGMSAAIAAYERGLRDILIIEREDSLGGILRQCIHNGFGLHTFGEELTGPEYAYRYEERVRELGISVLLETTVLDVSADKVVTATNSESGIFALSASAIILAMGCRERPRGALNIAGTRPSGIYSAGAAQKLVNMRGYLPGRDVVILGSGDIGLIMARRMTLEGARVHAVCELMPYSGGLARNIEQCLNDFDIPLYLSHTVVRIHGNGRLEGVTVAEVDEKRRPKPETERYIPCDTLLLSVGLVPENELTRGAGAEMSPVTGGAVVDESRQTNIEGVFACGNVLHVHDLVDFVSSEASLAGEAAADYILGGEKNTKNSRKIRISTDGRVRYTVPQIVNCERESAVDIYFRVADVYRDAKITVRDGEDVILSRKSPRLAPGEMERVTLKPEILRKAKSLHFSIELSGGEV